MNPFWAVFYVSWFITGIVLGNVLHAQHVSGLTIVLSIGYGVLGYATGLSWKGRD